MAGTENLCNKTVIESVCKAQDIKDNADILAQLKEEFCSLPNAYSILDENVIDLGGGDYQIAIVSNPAEGSLAFTETMTVYEFDGENWKVKFDDLNLLTDVVEESEDFIISNDYRSKHILSTKDTQQNITVPLDELLIGFKTFISSKGSGIVRIEAETGVTILRAEGKYLEIDGQQNGTWLIKEKENTWGAYYGLKDLPSGYQFISPNLEILNPDQTPQESLYWLQVYKSSDWPEFAVSSPYFCIWSTDHASVSDGRVMWGEIQDPMLNGFEYKGVIVSDYQSETPWLIRVPSSESGILDEIFLYYHTSASDPRNEPGAQETHLITTSGGNELHLCTWDDRGKPLGLLPGEEHTGYCVVHRRAANDYVAIHATRGNNPTPIFYISTSTNALSFTRLQQTNDIPAGDGYFSMNALHYPFMRDGTQYGISKYVSNAGPEWAALSKLDSNYRPYELVKLLSSLPEVRTLNKYIENEVIYGYFKDGVDASDNQKNYTGFTYDISDFDYSGESVDLLFNTGGYLTSNTDTNFDFNLPIEIHFTPFNTQDFVLITKGYNNRPYPDNRYNISYVGGEIGFNLVDDNGVPTGTDLRYSVTLNLNEVNIYRAFEDSGDLVQEFNGVEIGRDNMPVMGNVLEHKFRVGNSDTDYTNPGNYERPFYGLINKLIFGNEIFDFDEGYGHATVSSDGTVLTLNGATWKIT